MGSWCRSIRQSPRRGTRGSSPDRAETHSRELQITGAHVIVYSKDADADRAFFRDVLGFPSVDAGHGWLLFAMPGAETAFHPSEKNNLHELYFLCGDLKAMMAELKRKKVSFSEVHEERWGSVTRMKLPGGGEIGLYQPKHPTALKQKSVR